MGGCVRFIFSFDSTYLNIELFLFFFESVIRFSLKFTFTFQYQRFFQGEGEYQVSKFGFSLCESCKNLDFSYIFLALSLAFAFLDKATTDSVRLHLHVCAALAAAFNARKNEAGQSWYCARLDAKSSPYFRGMLFFNSFRVLVEFIELLFVNHSVIAGCILLRHHFYSSLCTVLCDKN